MTQWWPSSWIPHIPRSVIRQMTHILQMNRSVNPHITQLGDDQYSPDDAYSQIGDEPDKKDEQDEHRRWFTR